MKKGNLVVLMYPPNTCYTRVVKFRGDKIDGLEVDIENEVWSYTIDGSEGIFIGRSRNLCGKGRHGVIGVYDRMNIEHLNTLVFDGREATRDRLSLVDD